MASVHAGVWAAGVGSPRLCQGLTHVLPSLHASTYHTPGVMELETVCPFVHFLVCSTSGRGNVHSPRPTLRAPKAAKENSKFELFGVLSRTHPNAGYNFLASPPKG